MTKLSYLNPKGGLKQVSFLYSILSKIIRLNIILLIVTYCFHTVAFSQNTLQYYIVKAEQNSPLLQKQYNNKKLIDLDLKQFNAIYKSPNINLSSNAIFSPIITKVGNSNKFEWVSSGSSDYIGYDLGASNGGQFQTLISIDQPLFTQTFFSAQKNKANISQKRNINSAQLTKSELKQLVTHQYILVVKSQKQKKNIQDTMQILEEQIQQMKSLVNEGIYKLIDLKLLEIELQNNQIEEEQLDGMYLENLSALNLLCGINDTTFYQMDDIKLDLNSSSVTHSLFTMQFRLDSLSVEAEHNLFNLQYLPKLSIFGDAGLNATYLPKLNRFGFSFGISLKWNLFDGHQKDIIKEKMHLQLLNIETDCKYFQSQNDIRKKYLLSQINNLDKQIHLIDSQISDYNDLLNLYQIEIKESLISVLELKTLIREITAKRQIKINTLMTKEIFINTYNYWNL